MAVRILIADSDPAFRNHIRDAIRSNGSHEVVALARDGQEAIQAAVQFRPDIAFLSDSLLGISGTQSCEIISAVAPEVMCAIISDSKSQDRVASAMRAGARALVVKPLDSDYLNALISELSEAGRRRHSSEFAEWKDPSKYPRIISVTGAKGGVGKSTVAVNLAAVLAKSMPNKVALVDLYTQFGDVATMFNIAPKRTILDMIPTSGGLDSDLIQHCVTKHASGVDILVTSTKPFPMDVLAVENLDSVLYELKRSYRYIIVDVPPMLHAITLHVLVHSTNVLLIANLFDLTTATDTQKLYRALRGENIPKEAIGIVLNRVSKVNKLQSVDVEGMFESNVLAYIPNDGRLVNSVNQGIPLVTRDGDSPLRRSFDQLAEAVIGKTQKAGRMQHIARPKKRVFRMR